MVYSKIISNAVENREKLLKEMLDYYKIGMGEVSDRVEMKEFGNGGQEYYVDGELALTIHSIEYSQDGEQYIANQTVTRHYVAPAD